MAYLYFISLLIGQPVFHVFAHWPTCISYLCSSANLYFISLLIGLPAFHIFAHRPTCISYLCSLAYLYFISLLIGLPVFEVVDKSASQQVLDGLLGLVQQALGGRVPHRHGDDAAVGQAPEQPVETATVVARVVGVEAVRDEHRRRVLVQHAQVDAPAEVPLEGITPRGQAGSGHRAGQEGPRQFGRPVELQGPARPHTDELPAQPGHLGGGPARRSGPAGRW